MAEQSMKQFSRRGVLGSGAVVAGAAAMSLMRPTNAFAGGLNTIGESAGPASAKAAPAPTPLTPQTWAVQPFSETAVRLGQSVFSRAFEQELVLFRAYSTDRLLAVFRRNAGLETGGANPPGGWEEYGPHPDDQRWGPREYKPGKNSAGAGGLLRGHYAGHFLSGLSLAFAATSDEALRSKVDEVVDGLAECREALAAQTYDGAPRYSHPGFLSAYGEWQFSALEDYAPYGEIWAPYYTLHKITAGLLDAHLHTGNETALELAEGIGHWVYSRLSACSQEQRQKMWSLYIAGEYGGMNEALVELYWRSSDPQRDEFLEAADLFTMESFVDSCVADQDTLTDKHANQHIPQFSGYVKMATATGESRYMEAAKNLFGMVVPGRMYAHGGTGEGELWGPPNTVAGDIGSRNCESCAAYNMLKVARFLFFNDPDPVYMDYYERTVLNHILGGRRDEESTDSPENLYMFPVNPGGRKEYGNGNIGTCCGGTSLESHVKYQDSIYFHSQDNSELYVNLYIASTLDWEETGLGLEMVSDYPEDETVSLTVTSAPTEPIDVLIRIPSWVASGAASIAINGQTQELQIKPGTYVRLERAWKKGDEIAVNLPMRLRLEATLDRWDIQSLHYGPTTLVAVDNSSHFIGMALADRFDLSGSPTRGVTKHEGNVFNVADLEFHPAYDGKDVRYHMYIQRDDATVSFAGSNSGVRNPQREGKNLVQEVWEHAPFADRMDFLSKVTSVTAQYVGDGRLNSRDRQRILLAAGRAPIDGGL